MITALHGSFHHSKKQSTTSATATVFVGCAHGLDFAMCGGQRLQCHATDQLIVFPKRPETDVGRPELFQVQSEYMLCWTQCVHVGQVLAQQRMNLGAAQVIGFDAHGAVAFSGLDG